MTQTAIECLLSNLPERFKNAILNSCKELIEKSKQMEKEQIINAFDMGCQDEDRIGSEYYNETYKQ